MGKVNDLKAYYKELAAKHNVDQETMSKLEEVLGKDAVYKMLSEGFKPLPDYSADLDATRDRTKSEIENQYKEWYTTEQQKYNEYRRVVDEHKAYRDRFGALDGNGGGNGNGGNGGGGDGSGGTGGQVLTREEIEKILDGRMSHRDANTLDYLEIRERHMVDFKKPLDRKSFEDFWKAHPEYSGMTAAYDKYVEPEITKIKEADINAKMEARYQEGLRDGASRRSTPINNGQREFSPLLDQKPEVVKMSEREQDQHSRNSFFETLNNPGGNK